MATSRTRWTWCLGSTSPWQVTVLHVPATRCLPACLRRRAGTGAVGRAVHVLPFYLRCPCAAVPRLVAGRHGVPEAPALGPRDGPSRRAAGMLVALARARAHTRARTSTHACARADTPPPLSCAAGKPPRLEARLSPALPLFAAAASVWLASRNALALARVRGALRPRTEAPPPHTHTPAPDSPPCHLPPTCCVCLLPPLALQCPVCVPPRACLLCRAPAC
jgi:hypothetical protein